MERDETPVDEALHALLEMIDEGVEYPDAQWKCCRKFKVSAQALQDAYDDLG